MFIYSRRLYPYGNPVSRKIIDCRCSGPVSSLLVAVRTARLPFTMPKQVVAREHLLEFSEAFLGETLLEFRGRDVVEVF